MNVFEVIAAGVLVAILFFNFNFDLYDTESSCKSRWSSSTYTSKFTRTSGCLVRVNNVWVKEDNISFNISEKP